MKTSFLSSIILLVCLFGNTFSLKAQNEKFKAIFIYNFTKYINWPASEGDFVINVLGDDAITREIGDIATKKTVGNAKIKISKILVPSDIRDCKILYIASGKADYLPEIFLIAKKNNILVITEKTNSCKNGSCINFISKDGKLTFEVSKSNIDLCGLEVSSDLLKLGQAAAN
jgi:hypothetical protein